MYTCSKTRVGRQLATPSTTVPNQSHASDSDKEGDICDDSLCLPGPNPRHCPLPGHTLRKRLRSGTSTPSDAKSRMRLRVTQASGVEFPEDEKEDVFCAVTRIGDFMEHIQYCHVIPRVTPLAIVTQLEWCWDQNYHTLNLDSSQNILPLVSNLHYDFDSKGGWFLIPKDTNLLQNLYKRYVLAEERYDPEKLYEMKSFKYQLIAHSSMKRSSSVRQYTGSYDIFNPQEMTHFVYPFEDFPLCDLHISPHFAICHAGRKIAEHLGVDEALIDKVVIKRVYGFEPTSQQLGDFRRMLAIYRAWTSRVVPASFTSDSSDPTMRGGQPGDNDNREGPLKEFRYTEPPQDDGDGSMLLHAGRSRGAPMDLNEVLPTDSISHVLSDDYEENGSTDGFDNDNEDLNSCFEDEQGDNDFYDGIEKWRQHVHWKETVKSGMVFSDSACTLVEVPEVVGGGEGTRLDVLHADIHSGSGVDDVPSDSG